MRLAPFASRYAGDAMVCAIDHLAAGAGVAVLREGGSAADAAVAASAVLAVTNQHMCGMGGDLFALVQEDGTAPVALNASGRAGSGADPDRLRREGHSFMPRTGDIRCVPVPGCVDGWLALHVTLRPAAPRQGARGRHGVRRGGLSRLALAHRGGPVGASASRRRGLLRRNPPWCHRPASRSCPGPAGGCRGRTGRLLRRRVRRGPPPPRRGRVRRGRPGHAFADWVEPLSVEAFGSRIWTTPPNSQGYLTLAAAWIADGLGLPDDTDDPLWAHLVIEAACQAAYDRTDVLHEHADGARLLAPERLAARRAAISPEAASLLPGSYGAGDTIYLCAVDRDRMGVSLIQSNAGSFGSELAETSTGIFLQNRGVGFSLEPGHPAEYGPGRRPPHTLSPALVTSPDHSLQAVIGTMGGDAQPQILLQLLCRILHSGEAVGEAMAAPRRVLSNAWDPGGFRTWCAGREIHVELEPTAPERWPAGLRGRGHSVVRHGDFGLGTGHAHVIACRDGYLEGASDPRALEGAAAGY